MQKDSAKKLIIQSALQNSFNKKQFVDLVKNILNHFEDAPFVYKGNFIFDDFADSIKTVERIGKYKDPEGKLIDILIVRLKKETTLERARTKQRNFIAKYLKGSRGGVLKDAALAAFVSPNEDDWRFSLVKMEYKFNKKGKVEEEFTPARRYSFLVGKNENSHTAQSRLLPLLLNDEVNPTLAELEETFSVERVTKEFFEKYRDLFLRLKESLDEIVKKDPKVKADFKEKNVDTVDFAKKLLGQIVFLYFLQKKGWFGVPRGKDWGEGDKKFLRTLFDIAQKENKNYFNRFLEPLFYEALRLERPKDYYDQFNCRIPFLNGGLFDPINEYDWQDTDIEISNDIFSNNRKTKEGDTGDGILDVFDRYNFTVKEDEPLEKEVAIDPEMLGKVFENLLEVKDRKSKGTYYTPREIVHYMCQESLANYLATELKGLSACDDAQAGKVENKDIETLIKYGETAVEHDATYLEKTANSASYKGRYDKAKLPDNIRKHAKLIDEKLASIRVCDPAVGSGAFLVGMMNEIIRTRNALTPYLSACNAQADIGKDDERTPYNFKRHAIQNCLYGVDIDPGAVEIAKLRLWLSLIVDEEDREKIQPLPNLDYKIMQGNSLLSEFMGIDFDKESNYKMDECLFLKDDTDALIEELKRKKDEYLNKASAGEKQNLKQEIEDLIIKIFEEKLKRQKSDYFSKIKDIEEKYKGLPNVEQRENIIKEEKEKLYKASGFNIEQFEKQLREYTTGNKTRPFFPWKLYFAEVFHEKKGFDVVIANPPYVRADSGSEYLAFRKKLEESKTYKTLYEKWDLMVPFIEKGLRITNPKGDLTYIVSNAICTSKYAFKLLDWIQDEFYTYSIDYFEDMAVFEAGVIPVVLHIGRTKGDGYSRKIIHNGSFENVMEKTEVSVKEFKTLGRDAFRKEFTAMELGARTILLGDICYLSVGMVINADEKVARGEFTKDDLISKSKNKLNSRAYVEGKDISAYIIHQFKYLEWGTKRVPGQLRRQTFPELYDRPKLMRGRVTKGIYDDSGLLCNDSIVVFVRFIDLHGVNNKSIQSSVKKFNQLPFSEIEKISEKFDLKYILAILNSSFAIKYLNNIRRHRLENYFYPDDFRKLPIADILPKDQLPFIDLVDKILAITKDNDYLENTAKQAKVREYEKQIDQLVYKLYGLTEDEIKIVEGDIR